MEKYLLFHIIYLAVSILALIGFLMYRKRMLLKKPAPLIDRRENIIIPDFSRKEEIRHVLKSSDTAILPEDLAGGELKAIVEFSGDTSSRIRRLKRLTGVDHPRDVIRDALRYYEHYILNGS